MHTTHDKDHVIDIGPFRAKWCYGHKSYRMASEFYVTTSELCMKCTKQKRTEGAARARHV